MSTYILTSMFPNGLQHVSEVFRSQIDKRDKFVFVASEFEKLHEKTDKYFEFFLNMFKEIGICFEESCVVDGRMSMIEAQQKVSEADVIWLSGGDTFAQIAYLQKYGLKKVINEFDGVIIGMSAGSINMAKTSICTLSCGHQKQEIYSGLGCVDISVEPHFIRNSVSNELIEISQKHTLYGLCDDGVIVCSGNTVKCYGEVHKLYNGIIEKL